MVNLEISLYCSCSPPRIENTVVVLWNAASDTFGEGDGVFSVDGIDLADNAKFVIAEEALDSAPDTRKAEDFTPQPIV